MLSNRSFVVLHYTGYTGCTADGGGVHRVIRTLAHAGGHWRTILGVSTGFVPRFASQQVLWRGPDVMGETIGLFNLGRTLLVAWRVRRWLRRGAHRIFHGHSRAGLLVALWLRLFGERRALATVHILGRQRWFYRMAKIMLGSRLRWLSPAMAEYYGENGIGWNDCLTDCVPPHAFRPAKTARRHRPGVTFGCVGSLVPVKGWEIVIRALALIPTTVPLRVVHVGADDGSTMSAEYADGLRQLCEELRVTDRFEWRGQLNNLSNFFDEIDCLVVASRLEASSVAALEALAADVPVLAPDTGGTRALINRCNGGWVFATDSTEVLARRLEELATGTELTAWRRNDAGLDAFSVQQVIAAHVEVYRLLR